MDTETIDKVEEAIIEGAKNAYSENVQLTLNYTDLETRIIESLVTVNVAQSLLKMNDTRYRIQLEYPLADFYNGAFPERIWPDVFVDMKFRKNHNPADSKSKRIDIAIVEEKQDYHPGFKSLIGIEVKPINKSNKAIVKDIKRLSQGLANKDDIGDNGIIAGYSIFYRRLDNVNAATKAEEIESLKIKEKNKWQNKLNDIQKTYAALKYEIKEVILKSYSLEKAFQGMPPEEFEYYEAAAETGLVICYLIKITH